MEVDTMEESVVSSINSPIHLWYSLGSEGVKRIKVNLDLTSLTLEIFRNTVCQQFGSLSPNDIEILYNARQLKDDESFKAANIKPSSLITIYKRNHLSQKTKVNLDAASKKVKDQIHQVALALRTAFFNPNFIPTIEKLGQSEKLENILAMVPGLKADPVGIAIIQDPAMIFHLSDAESLRKLAATKPWVIEAFNFLAASVHQEGGSQPPSRGIPAMFNPSMFEGDGEDEEMDEDDNGAAGPSSRITREQLSAALNSLSALGRGALSAAGSGGQSSSNPPPSFLEMLSRASGQASGQAQAQASSLHQPGGVRPPSSTAPAGPGVQVSATGQPVNVDIMARAIADALSRLPPGERAEQYNAIRGLATEIQNAPGQPSRAPPTSTTNPSLSNPLTAQYREQLIQMRDMGITDERLSVLALQVSDGDVAVAVELIFSGWTGEGADSI